MSCLTRSKEDTGRSLVMKRLQPENHSPMADGSGDGGGGWGGTRLGGMTVQPQTGKDLDKLPAPLVPLLLSF